MAGRLVLFMVLSLTLTTRSSLADEQLPSAILSPDETEVVTFSVDANNNATTLQLNCSGVGTLSWYRGEPPNAEDLSGFTTLLDNNLLMLTISPVINNTDASNAGIPYYCVANNTLGQARSRTVLVKYAFFNGFEAENTTTEITVRVGEAVAMSCGVLGAAPPPNYVWFKNNMTIETSDRITTLDDGATLVIYDLTMEDVDDFEYKCGVTNARMFDTEISTRIYRLKEDTFSESFIAYRRPKSAIVTTTELANGVTFYYIGAISSGNTRLFGSVTELVVEDATLSATISVVPNDQLALSLSGANQIQESSSPFNLTVIEPLVVIDRPSNISTIYHRFTNESINFTCTATGTGTQLQWFRNAEKFQVINPTTLVFDRVSVSNSGVYQCFWEESEDGTFELDTWALIVEDPVPPNSFVFTSSAIPSISNPNRTIVPTNDSVSLTLEFRADDVESITWFRNETETGKIEEIVFPNSLYSISGPNRTDMEDWFRVVFTIVTVNNLTSGFYYAEINDGRTPVVTSPVWFVSEEVMLQIVSISLSPHNCLLEGVVNTIQCVVRGLPDPMVDFEISTVIKQCPTNGSCEIMQKLEGLVTTTDLIYNSVSEDDEGVYTCFARNSRSALRDNLPLNYSGQLQFCRSPRITKKPDPVISRTEEADITLSCTVDSEPLPSAIWYRDGVELMEVPNRIDIKAIDSEGVFEVTLMNVSVNDTGIYTCSFTNIYIPADVSYSTNLTVMAAEVVTTEPPETSTSAAWIPVAAGVGAGLALLLILAIILVVCLCCCLVRSNQKKGSYTTKGVSMSEFTDGRGNVDKDSDEEDEGAKHPEAFQPQYESLPVVRPAVPPDYKPSPAYGNQFPGQNDEFDMMKPPIPDDNQGSFQYHPQQFFQGDNGGMAIHGSMMQGLQGPPPMGGGPPMGSTMGLQQPRFEDFMSDDEKFV